MNYKKVFVDANVLIDLFDTERPLRERLFKNCWKVYNFTPVAI